MVLNESLGYHIGASVVCVAPFYKGVVRKIGIVSSILKSTDHAPYLITYNNGITVPQTKNEIVPLSWYLMIRKEAIDGEFGDSPISPRYT